MLLDHGQLVDAVAAEAAVVRAEVVPEEVVIVIRSGRRESSAESLAWSYLRASTSSTTALLNTWAGWLQCFVLHSVLLASTWDNVATLIVNSQNSLLFTYLSPEKKATSKYEDGSVVHETYPNEKEEVFRDGTT